MAATRDPWAFQRWAYQAKTGDSTSKAVLMALAAMAEKTTGECQASQATLAEFVETSIRTICRHLSRLEERGLIARRHRYSGAGKRASDRFLLLSEWVSEWHDGTPIQMPLDATLACSNAADYTPNGASTTRHQWRDKNPLRGHIENPLRGHTPHKAPSGALRGARARARPVELAVFDAVDRVAEAKGCASPDDERVLRLCERFADRELAVDAEEFEHYWLHGKGENGRVRDVVATLGNWLKRSPSAAARGARPPSAKANLRAQSRARAAAAWDRMQQEATA
jgi:DNA-binding transcriptional ArsR family regulator